MVTVGAASKVPPKSGPASTAVPPASTAAKKSGSGVPGKVQGSFSTLCSGIGC
jgi:hypothetical protein